MGLIWGEAMEWGEGRRFSRYLGQIFPQWREGWEAMLNASSRWMEVLSQPCWPGCCLKIQLSQSLMRRACGLPAGSGTVPMVTGSLQDKARDTHLLQMSENRKQVQLGRRGGRKKWQESGLASGWDTYHKFQEKGGEPRRVLAWTGRTTFPSADWSWEKWHDGAYEADVGGI